MNRACVEIQNDLTYNFEVTYKLTEDGNKEMDWHLFCLV
jgi:hypothetical protein